MKASQIASTALQILLPFLLKDDRRAADERLKKEQDKVDRALQAARNVGDKDREVKDLAAQVNALTVSIPAPSWRPQVVCQFVGSRGFCRVLLKKLIFVGYHLSLFIVTQDVIDINLIQAVCRVRVICPRSPSVSR